MSRECRARLQSDPDGDSNPYRCDQPKGHEGPHRCGCGCGMAWGQGKYGPWQGYDLKPGLLVFRRGATGWIRELIPTGKPGRWDLRVHRDASDYVAEREGYGARDKETEYVWEYYAPVWKAP